MRFSKVQGELHLCEIARVDSCRVSINSATAKEHRRHRRQLTPAIGGGAFCDPCGTYGCMGRWSCRDQHSASQ